MDILKHSHQDISQSFYASVKQSDISDMFHINVWPPVQSNQSDRSGHSDEEQNVQSQDLVKAGCPPPTCLSLFGEDFDNIKISV